MVEMEDNMVPIYRFEWDDGNERRTDEIEEQKPEAIEALAELGRRDDECEVVLVGYST